MAYFAPYIDDAGLHIPTYIDIREDLIDQFKQIYGQDIYLDNESQDYQMISAFALKTYDTMQLLQIIYNNRSPKTAVGSAMDGIVKLNGIKRKASSYSTCVLTLTGTPGTTIINGVTADDAGVQWTLPAAVTLSGSTRQVSAVCAEIGAIEAAPGSITKIVTPTQGWLAVTNEAAAVTGAPVESDEELRRRQSLSVAIPSQNMLDGTIAGIASVDGVKRYKIYDNDSNITDEHGIPGHTIAAVVEGGLDDEVAEQIYLRKGPGGGTYGDVSVEYINSDGLTTIIRFFRPEYVAAVVELVIKKNAGYTSEIKERIEKAIKAYLEALDIGTAITITGISAAVLSVIDNWSKPAFSVVSLNIGRQGDTLANEDIPIIFKEVGEVGTIDVREG
ncbi:MAG: baseplate J/gp47 family protein [Sporomusaceae bacterium]|nr:baseplate J/gp47 family protein [Sporomusaceae bacterium]